MKYKKCIKRLIITLLALSGIIYIGFIYSEFSEKTQEINKNRNNIALLYSGSELSYYAINHNIDNLKLAFSHSIKALSRSSYTDIIPSLLNVNSIPYSVPVNIEMLLKNDIRIALVWDQMKKFYQPIKNSNIKLLKWKCCERSDIPNKLRSLGNLANKQERAEEVILFQQNEYNKLAKKLEKHGLSKISNMVTGLQIRYRKGKMQLTLYENLGTSGIKLPGKFQYTDTVNVAVNSRPMINNEELLKLDPYIIIIKGIDKTNPQDVYSHPVLKNLSAAKHQRIYKIPNFGNIYQEPLLPLTFQWIAMMAYPKTFAYEIAHFRNKLKDAYKKIYLADVEDIILDKILLLNINGVKYASMFKKHI